MFLAKVGKERGFMGQGGLALIRELNKKMLETQVHGVCIDSVKLFPGQGAIHDLVLLRRDRGVL